MIISDTIWFDHSAVVHNWNYSDVDHVSFTLHHILDLLSIEYFLNPISILRPWPKTKYQVHRGREDSPTNNNKHTLFVAQRIFTAFAVSILNELSGAIDD